jgi:ATP-binding cassette, subfamily B, bacterial
MSDAAESGMGPAGFLRSLYPYLRAYRWQCALILLISMLEMSFNALVPMTFRELIDYALPHRDARALFWMIVALGLGLLIVALSGLARDYLYAQVTSRVLSDIRRRLYQHLQFLSMDFYARSQTGDLLARFSTDLAAIEQSLILTIPWGLVPSLDVALSSVLLFWLNWKLALVAMLIWPLCLTGPRFFAPRASRASYFRKQEEARTATMIQENILAQGTVKAFGLEGLSVAQFGQQNAELLKVTSRLSFLSAMMERSAGVGILVLQVLIISVGAFMVFRGRLTIGTLAAFQAIFINLSYGLYNVAQYIPQTIQAGGGMSRIEELLGQLPKITDGPGAAVQPPFQNQVEFRNVSFSYAGNEIHLRDVNITIPRGSFVAFVGPSGSGKSTLLNMLMRFYDVAGGALLVDGYDVRSVTTASLRAQFGVVFQDSFLFNISLRENIRLGRPDATNADVENAARAAEIHDFILTLPEKYDTMTGERGGRLSGGQRQRMALARALLRNPPILLLDEATSALDGATESAINATLSRAARNCTMISVTHRLASAVAADCIYVLEKGQIVEEGRHHELLGQGGVYARMWQKQNGFVMQPEQERIHVEPAWLRTVPLLAALDEELLSEISGAFVTEAFPKGRHVVYQGDPGDKFFVVVRGTVEVIREEASGSETRLAVLEDGDYFGEVALLQNTARNASVRTLTAAVFLCLQRGQFLGLIDRVPALRARMIEAIRAREQAPGAKSAAGQQPLSV